MKPTIYIIIILLFSANLSAQVSINGIIKDSLTREIVPYASISYLDENIGVTANEEGRFQLKKISNLKSLQISSLGYENKKIGLKDLDSIIYLVPKLEFLDEIVINTKKNEYSKNVKLGLDQTLKVRTNLPFGYEFSTFVANPYNKKGIIKEVILNLNKSDKYDFIATYNIKFYKFDTIKKQPGEEIYSENVFVSPKNKTYILKIDVEELNISLPKEGVCIGVELINKENFKISSMSIIAPKINFTHSKEKHFTWTRFMNKKWDLTTYKSVVKDNQFVNANINITAKLEK